jgi:hypothetical protein
VDPAQAGARRLAALARAYGLAPGARAEFVEAIVAGKRAAWLARGGDKGDAEILAWLESSRGAFLDALQR